MWVEVDLMMKLSDNWNTYFVWSILVSTDTRVLYLIEQY
jgi:hypothetical protein